jgi:cold shock CspA family protein
MDGADGLRSGTIVSIRTGDINANPYGFIQDDSGERLFFSMSDDQFKQWHYDDRVVYQVRSGRPNNVAFDVRLE